MSEEVNKAEDRVKGSVVVIICKGSSITTMRERRRMKNKEYTEIKARV